jgi:hypothetical protein
LPGDALVGTLKVKVNPPVELVNILVVVPKWVIVTYSLWLKPVPVTSTLVPTGPDEGLRVILGAAACTTVDAMRKTANIASTEIASDFLARCFLFIFLLSPFSSSRSNYS